MSGSVLDPYVPGSKKIAYRWVSNWLELGTCCAAIVLSVDWIDDCDIVGLNTYTFGPKLAPGDADATAGATAPTNPSTASTVATRKTTIFRIRLSSLRSATIPGADPTTGNAGRWLSVGGGPTPRPCGHLEQRPHVRHRPEVPELGRIDDRADAGDLPARDLECPHRDQATVAVEQKRAGRAVDLDRPQRRSRNAGAPPDPIDQRAGDARAPVQPAGQRGHLGTAVAGQDDVVREQGLEAGDVSVLYRGEEPARELVALLARGLKARPALFHMSPRPYRELAHGGFALAHDRRDLVVAVVEHVTQQEHRALLGREALEHYEQRQRDRIGHLGLARRIVRAVGHDRLRGAGAAL